MKSHVYLNPMTPDGKPGEVKEIVYEGAGSQQFLAPVSYVANDDVAKLRANVHTARAKLIHAKSRGVGVAEAEKALEAASAAAGQAHYQQQKAREQQRIGGDAGAMDPFSRQSDDKRLFAEVQDYSRDDNDEADDSDDDALEVKILAAVEALEQAQAAGASPATMKKLEDTLKVLREQRQSPLREQDPARRTTAPTGRAGDPNNDGLIIDPAQKGKKAAVSAGQSLREFAIAVAAAVGVPVKKKKTKAETKLGWDQHLADLDEQLKARALIAVYPPRPESPSKSTHAKNICCQGKYLCAECRAKKAAAA